MRHAAIPARCARVSLIHRRRLRLCQRARAPVQSSSTGQRVAADTEKKSSSFYSDVFKQLYILSFGLLWVLNPITKIFILLFMNSNYHTAARYVSFLYLGTVFQSFASFYGVGYLRDKKTKNAFLSEMNDVLQMKKKLKLIDEIVFIDTTLEPEFLYAYQNNPNEQDYKKGIILDFEMQKRYFRYYQEYKKKDNFAKGKKVIWLDENCYLLKD